MDFAFDDAMRFQAPWINALADGLVLKDVQTFQSMVIAVRQKLESSENEQV